MMGDLTCVRTAQGMANGEVFPDCAVVAETRGRVHTGGYFR